VGLVGVGTAGNGDIGTDLVLDLANHQRNLPGQQHGGGAIGLLKRLDRHKLGELFEGAIEVGVEGWIVAVPLRALHVVLLNRGREAVHLGYQAGQLAIRGGGRLVEDGALLLKRLGHALRRCQDTLPRGTYRSVSCPRSKTPSRACSERPGCRWCR
jgi:hypothetical protein